MGGSASTSLKTVTWNIAAINNNPFEYWITHDDAAYNKLMEGFQEFIDAPGAKDVPVSEVFTDSMFEELKGLMASEGWDHLDQTTQKWNDDYKSRKIIGGFMKDKEIGSKRLASMPDRITNTINTVNEGQVYRPTVINLYEGKMDSVPEWWTQWKAFMFGKEVSIKSKAGPETKKVCSLLEPISRAKYPAVTEEEEQMSIPLQTLCQAIFDAVLVHIMGSVEPNWHALKVQLSDALVKNKDHRTIEILEKTYADADIIFLQEVAGLFIDKASGSQLPTRYHTLLPAKLDGKRDQNSIILLSKAKFNADSVQEVTDTISQAFDKAVPVANGDLFAVTVEDKNGGKYLMASFHGDTNGLATIPVVEAVHSFSEQLGPDTGLIFGLDANTYVKDAPGKMQGVEPFSEWYVSKGLTSCWGDSVDVATSLTTCNARTYLQAQLNKAVKADEKTTKGDTNPKDFILFHKAKFAVSDTMKDNGGNKTYVEGMCFPTLAFPSDHAILSATLTLKPKSEL